ncbi:MAG: phage holin [Atopobiaceae bacterium]|nr:phage holin [Atopobiaceae bacterium]
MNWKVRIRNKWFWITLIPAVLLLVQQVLAIFGVTIDLHDVEAQVLAIVETVFLILGILGIAVDMTTDGIGDSKRAMGYEKPWKEESNEL